MHPPPGSVKNTHTDTTDTDKPVNTVRQQAPQQVSSRAYCAAAVEAMNREGIVVVIAMLVAVTAEARPSRRA
jgi:hypothetical protein